MNKIHEIYDTLILSGGGTKGFCTLGALQYMQDKKLIDPDVTIRYIGTSIGSMICFFLTIGYTPIEIVVSLCSNNVFESFKINRIEDILENGVYNYNIIQEHCKKMILEKLDYIPTLLDVKNKLNKELIITTYNFTEKKQEYMNYINYPDLNCLDAIRMSSNIPFIFNEFFYDGKEYIDGGFCDNLPLSCVNKEDKSVAIYLTDKIKTPDTGKEPSQSFPSVIMKVVDKIYNLLLITVSENTRNKIKMSENSNIDIVKISIEDVKIYKFNMTHSEKLELFSLGYNAAKEYFKS